MKFLVFIFVLASAYAQVSAIEKTVVPASKADVQELQKELKYIRQDALVAEKNYANRSAMERQKMLQENKVAIEAAERNLKNKLESIEREARKASDDQRRTQRIEWSITGVVVLGLLVTFLMIRKNHKKIATTFSSEEPKLEILKDPDIPGLKAYSARNNGIQKIPFVLTLQDGEQFNCVAELKQGLAPLVYIENDPIPVAWDKRRKMAVRLATAS